MGAGEDHHRIYRGAQRDARRSYTWLGARSAATSGSGHRAKHPIPGERTRKTASRSRLAHGTLPVDRSVHLRTTPRFRLRGGSARGRIACERYPPGLVHVQRWRGTRAALVCWYSPACHGRAAALPITSAGMGTLDARLWYRHHGGVLVVATDGAFVLIVVASSTCRGCEIGGHVTFGLTHGNDTSQVRVLKSGAMQARDQACALHRYNAASRLAAPSDSPNSRMSFTLAMKSPPRTCGTPLPAGHAHEEEPMKTIFRCGAGFAVLAFTLTTSADV